MTDSRESDFSISGEALRALRRGVMRSEGFSLFIAVCTQPAGQKRYIKLLDDSIPNLNVVTVTLTKETVNALDRITQDARTKNCGVLMVTGFEKVISSDTEDHPLLNSLNLSRPEWPARLPFPVVFWVPEYILGVLGRKTPDFLDWRSDTIYFPSLSDEEYEPLVSANWMGGGDGRMDKRSRRERIGELRSRIKLHSSDSDRAAQSALAEWSNELGIHLELFGQLHEAENAFKECSEISKRLGRRDGVAASYGNLGHVYRTRGDLDGALKMYNESLRVFEQLGRKKEVAASYGNLGLVYQTRGSLDRGEEMFNKSLEIFKDLGQLGDMANQYGSLGFIYRTRGDLDRAEELFTKSLEIFKKLDQKVGMANEYGSLGLIYRTRGDLDRAEEMHNKSLEIDKILGRLEGMAGDYGNLGLVYQARGDLHRAEEMIRKSLEIEIKLGHLEGVANQYGNLGNIYQTRGDPDRAEEMHKKSLEIDERLGRTEGMASGFANLARLYAERGDSAKAREFFVRARDLFDLIGIPEKVKLVDGWLDSLEKVEPHP